ncbi:MAG: hypothetical protein IPK20_18215 [Betaproteobacteria bacterium]|nr:hypothetical protein [Betaproteobacteria bacterium]
MTWLRLDAGKDSTVLASGAVSYDSRPPGTQEGDAAFHYYLRWSWDGKALEIESVPWGFAPVFYAEQSKSILVSTRIDEILAMLGSATIDETAIAVFTRLGFFLDSDTPFKEVKALSGAGRLRWTPDTGVALPGERPKPARLDVTREEAMREYAKLFRAAVRNRQSSRTKVVPLSGGRDSRHVVLELCAQGTAPDYCITAKHFPPKNNSDLEVALCVCAALGLRHVEIAQPRWRLQNDIAKNILTSYCSDEHTWALPLVNAIRGSATEVWDGIGGDVLSAGLFLVEKTLKKYTNGDLVGVATDLLERWNKSESMITHLIKEDLRHRVGVGVARERIIRELASHADCHNPLTSFYFWNRTRREIALYTFSMFEGIAQPVAPFLDDDLVPFLLALPAEHVIDHTFHTETISAAYPRWSHIEYEHYDEGQDARSYWRRFHLQLLGYCALRAGKSMLRPLPLARGLLREIIAPHESSWLSPIALQCFVQMICASAKATSIAKARRHLSEKIPILGTDRHPA